MTLTNPKRNGIQLTGVYEIDITAVWYIYGNGSKCTIATPMGLFYVADDISNYSTGLYQVSPAVVWAGIKNITTSVGALSFYVNRDYFLCAYATMDNSNSVTVSYTAPLNTVKGIIKVTHNLSGVVLYKNAGYDTNDFTSPDMAFDNLNLTQSCTKTIITGYMGLLDIDIKLEDNVLAVTTASFTQTLGGGVPATVLFDWGYVVLQGTVGVGSIKPLLSIRTGEDTIKQSSTGRTFMYNPKETIDRTSEYIEIRKFPNPHRIEY